MTALVFEGKKGAGGKEKQKIQDCVDIKMMWEKENKNGSNEKIPNPSDLSGSHRSFCSLRSGRRHNLN